MDNRHAQSRENRCRQCAAAADAARAKRTAGHNAARLLQALPRRPPVQLLMFRFLHEWQV